MSMATHFQQTHDDLKTQIINEIRKIVKKQDDHILELLETRKTPALVTQVIDDQESETIRDIYVDGKDRLIASAGVYEDDQYYDLNEFEIPFLIQILDSATIHSQE